jgi:hypothetical protein
MIYTLKHYYIISRENINVKSIGKIKFTFSVGTNISNAFWYLNLFLLFCDTGKLNTQMRIINRRLIPCVRDIGQTAS